MSDASRPFAHAPAAERIRAGMARMWAVSAVGRSGGQAVQLLAMIALARILVPADFGLLAMVMAIIGIANIFRDLGLSAATIRAPEITPAQASTLFLINVGFGALMTAIVSAAAPLLAWLYGDPRVIEVTLVLAWTFFLSGLGTQHQALLRRQLKFGILAWINLASVIVGQSSAIALALSGYGYWALVAAMLLTHLIRTVLVWLANPWRPGRPQFDRRVRNMISFGGYLVVFSLLGYVASNAHNVVIGWQYGADEVGYYSRAFLILTLLLGYVVTPLNVVAPAALARMIDEPERYNESYLHTVAMMLLLTAPIGFACAVVAEDLIAVVLGGQWGESVAILQILALAALPQTLCASSGWLYLSHGDSRRMMQWGVGGWGTLILLLIAGTAFGIRGVAIAYTAGMFLLLYPCMVMAFKRTTLRFPDLMRTAWPIALPALLAALPTWLVRDSAADWHLAWRLPTALLVYGSVYTALLVGVFRQGPLLKDVWGQLRGRAAA